MCSTVENTFLKRKDRRKQARVEKGIEKILGSKMWMHGEEMNSTYGGNLRSFQIKRFLIARVLHCLMALTWTLCGLAASVAIYVIFKGFVTARVLNSPIAFLLEMGILRCP